MKKILLTITLIASSCAHANMLPEYGTHPITAELVEATVCLTFIPLYSISEKEDYRSAIWLMGSACAVSLVGDIIMETMERIEYRNR